MSYERGTCSESSTAWAFCRCLTCFLVKNRKKSQKIAESRFKSYNFTANFSIFKIQIFRINRLLPPPDNRGSEPQLAQHWLVSRLLPSFNNRWVHLDTVFRQIFGDIQETQFSGSKMEVHVHLKNTFPGGIGTRRISLAIIFGLPPTPRGGHGSCVENILHH